MKVLVVHLSDLHIHEASDPVLGRYDSVAGALRDLDHEVECVLFVVAGDVAYEGDEDEYALAFEFFVNLQDSLTEQSIIGKSVPCKWFIVPGNHDCDFDRETEANELIRNRVQQEPQLASDSSIVTQLTQKQSAFFSALHYMESAFSPDPALIYSTCIEVGDRDIQLLGLNTAATSNLREEQGKLSFPTELIPEPSSVEGDVCLTVFHHPYNWLNADQKLELRKKIESVSDVVFTGHEHYGAGRDEAEVGSEVTRYLEGGILQDQSDPDRSSFNVLLLDLEQELQKFFQFNWDGGLFRLIGELDRNWAPLQLSQLRDEGEYLLSGETESWLRDPGVKLTHREREELTFEDIFVYPELQRVDLTRESGLIIESSDVFDTLRDQQCAIVTGDENAGKTALAKKLFLDFRNEDFVPVYIKGEELAVESTHSLKMAVYRSFERQYLAPDSEQYRQLKPARRVILIDDFHSTLDDGLRPSEKMKGLMSLADHLVLFSNEIEYDVGQLLLGMDDLDDGAELARFRIEEFGNYLRQKLVDKWYSMGTEVYEADEQFAQTLTETKRRVDTILGSGLVPPYPVFILLILQAGEASTPAQIDAGSYGAFYELSIRNALANVSSIQAFDIKIAYLSHIAFSMFVDEGETIDETRLLEVHREYQENFDLDLNLTNLIGELVAHDVLRQSNNGALRFRYRYAYYYFVASYIRLNIDRDEVKDVIVDLADSLHVEANANVLLFLAHLSKDEFVLDQLVEAAEGIFPDVGPVSMEETPRFLADLDETVRDVVYIPGDPKVERDRRLKARDRASREVDREGEAGPGTQDTLPEESVDIINRLNSAFKTVQILGQVLKNFPGSTSAARKRKLIQECYSLGRRSLGVIYQIIEDNRRMLIDDLVAKSRRDYGEDPDRLRRLAKRSLFSLTEFLSEAFIKNISRSVGNEGLDRSYVAVRGAVDVPIVDLIDCSIRLDHFREFPDSRVEELSRKFSDSNLLADTILRRFVVHHFRLFPRPERLRKRILEKLDVPYQGRRRAPADPKRLRRSESI